MSLPIGWTRVRLADVTVPKVEQGEPGATPVHYIDIGSIDRERKIIGPTEQVTAATAPTRARQRVRSGDVLVSMTRPNLNAVAMVPASLDQSVASTGFDVLRATKGVLPEWLYYRVRSHEFVEDICKGVQGVVYPAVRPDDIRSHELPLPPGDLQGAIVTELDSYLSRLDAITANLERAQARLKAYRASVLKAAVEGRLVPTEAELARKEKRSYETGEQLLARILKERRRRWEDAELARLKAAGKTPKDDKWKKKYVEPQPPDTSKLPKLSEGWSWASLSALLAEPLRNGRSAREAASGTRVFTLSSVTQGDFGIHNTKVAAIPSELADDLWARRGDIFIERSNTPELVGTAAMYRGDDNFAVFPDLLIRVRCSSHV